ncbi:hypothetical protein [Coraliomargarita akajimensis]|uniref:Uncharacterized protein n=1 Tax=Coraliomargarita akajimensis (strain DSM 45221 / IAM 15411 / JCM 23193 / KCTC 12865 / 04OKA010-24) TaxID=583355 RepID=D5EME4_CORAD|nr:hypothetical protein [Coraliomargarita akajimensis]ADE53350.1 conserved hypothetical protein [Coraliomargarita akajimensis DSM 45221]ADE55916.1 conserved hypothetical protein [Coraliomargarita akajimensis DSM 45221]
MRIQEDTAQAIGVALNEATLLGMEWSPEKSLVWSTFSVLTLPEVGPEPEDRRVVLSFENVGRIAMSYRKGFWNDYEAEVIRIKENEILEVIQSFGGQPIYGWEFINTEENELAKWEEKLSLEILNPTGSTTNRISLFQEGATESKHLDIWIWFESFRILNPQTEEISVSDFTEGGKRWWDALHAGDPRTDNHGIIPGKPE